MNVYLNVTLWKRQTNEMIIKHYISSIDQIVSHFSERLRIYDIVPIENESIESSSEKSRDWRTCWFLTFLGSGTQLWLLLVLIPF